MEEQALATVSFIYIFTEFRILCTICAFGEFYLSIMKVREIYFKATLKWKIY